MTTNIKNAIPLDKSPFDGLNLVCEILEFEGTPVLLHFSDQNKNNILFYWVDYSENGQRYLTWKIDDFSLKSYLNAEISILDLVNNSLGFYFFILDLDINDEFKKGYFLNILDIPENYLPDADSFYNYNYPKEYLDYFNSEDLANNNAYIKSLRDTGLDFTIKPASPTYGDTVGTEDAIQLLSAITKSYSEYAKHHFFSAFNDNNTDEKKLLKKFNAINPTERLRISNLSFSSFNVTLSSDTLSRGKTELTENYNDWNRKLLNDYKNEVIDNDFSNLEDVIAITEKFKEPSLRKKIFDPIIKIIESSSIKLEVSNSNKSWVKKYKSIDDETKKVIFPMIEKTSSVTPKKTIINIYLEVNEGDEIGEKTITKKDLKEKILFSEETNTFPIVIEEIIYQSYKFILTEALELRIKLIDDVYTVSYEYLDIEILVSDKKMIEEYFYRAFLDKYLNQYLDYKEKFDKIIVQIMDI